MTTVPHEGWGVGAAIITRNYTQKTGCPTSPKHESLSERGECMESNIWENWVDLPRGNFQQDQSEWEHHTLHSLSFLKPGVKNSSSFWAQLPFRSFNPWPSLLSLTSSSPSSPERRKKWMDEVFFPPLIYWILPFPNLFPSMILLQHSHHSEQAALTEHWEEGSPKVCTSYLPRHAIPALSSKD